MPRPRNSILGRLETFVRAQFSAFICGVCDYFIMILLTEFVKIHYTVSIIIACTLGAIMNFSVNKNWTFYSKNSDYKFSFTQQLWRFIFVVTSSIGLKTLGTYLLTTYGHIDYKISRLITDIIVSIFYNYMLQRYWVFKGKIIDVRHTLRENAGKKAAE
ncbi:MAG: GtrA family protein [Prevotellaceae bacterium]|jgi:putative flippase GtrA|nr:GtrA family protein [Prevotellaceae bacterium]